MKADERLELAHEILAYVTRLLGDMNPPRIPEAFAEDEMFVRFHADILELRGILAAFASGDLSPQITQRGVLAGACKALQANLRHMTWKVRQVEQGDYAQRMDFMGDFACSFNNMVVRLETTINALRRKEETLTELAVSLRDEVRLHSGTLRQLRRSEAEFKYLAQYDPLTDILNRRFFSTVVRERLRDGMALERDCCFCFMDIDMFKRFNDTYGHIEGDRALKFVAGLAQRNLRQTDVMGRYGGEEFVFFFENTDLKAGRAVAERIRAAVAAAPVALQNDHKVFLSVSLGVACLPARWAKTHDCAALQEQGLKLADAALYAAKRQGRNRVCVAPLDDAW